MRHLKRWAREGEALEGTPFNAPYGEAPLKKRAVFNLEATNNNNNNNSLYSHYSGKKKTKQRNYRKRNDRDYIIICSTITVSVQQPTE